MKIKGNVWKAESTGLWMGSVWVTPKWGRPYLLRSARNTTWAEAMEQTLEAIERAAGGSIPISLLSDKDPWVGVHDK